MTGATDATTLVLAGRAGPLPTYAGTFGEQQRKVIHRDFRIITGGGTSMATDNHYFVEQNDEGKFAVRAKGSDRASAVLDTQAEAIARAKELNPNDHPDVERVRHTDAGGPDKWRKA